MKRLALLALMCMCCSQAMAAISFTDGKWETTFDCAEQTQDVGSLDCDGMVWWGDDWYFDSYRTTIKSDANNPLGSGRGIEFWKGSGSDHMITGTVRVAFSTPQKEIWVRWYEKYESGFSWNVNQEETKELYFHDGTATSDPYVGFAYGAFETYTGVNGAPTSAFPRSETSGWDDIYPTGTADGTWHCFETYMKMDTNGTDGVGRLWVDGVLVASKTDVNWSANSGKPHAGWANFDFLENQKDPGLARAYYVHVDDIVVYNSTPPGRDAQNNPMIGPIADEEPEVSIPAKGSVLFTESFEDDSWSARGWWDGGASGGNAVVNSGGQSGNALTWTWAEDGDVPTGWEAMRNRLASSASEFLIEYYVRLETGWQGSGLDWQPLIIHLMSTVDGDYAGLAHANSGLYFEVSGSYPRTGHQDNLRVNTSNGTVPNDLRAVTETRSANHCNTPYSLSGADTYDCFAIGEDYYSANWWVSDTVSIPAGTWTKITAHVKRNTFTGGVGNFDGIMRLWVGDQLAISSDTVLYAAGAYQSTAWDKIVLAPYIGDGSPALQTMRLDELAVYEVANGSPPITPNGTRVQAGATPVSAGLTAVVVQ